MEAATVFEKVIAQINEKCEAHLVVQNNVCGFRTEDGVQWQISLIPAAELVAIEANLGSLVQMPSHAAATLLTLNGEHSTVGLASFAANPDDGQVRLQRILQLAQIDGESIINEVDRLHAIRSEALSRIAATTHPASSPIRDERRTFA